MPLILHPDFQLYERKDMPFCSSLQVAETFEKRHDHVLRDIDSLNVPSSGEISDFNRLNFHLMNYKDSRGRKQPMYLMTKDGFTLLVMGYTGEKAMRFKIAYIQRFNEYEQYIKNYIHSRDDLAPFTQAILDAHENPKSYVYSNECNMINRIVLGMDAKHFRELHGLQDSQSIRPFLNHSQAKAIRKLQVEDIRLLYRGFVFLERKQALGNIYEQKFLEG